LIKSDPKKKWNFKKCNTILSQSVY
jgi:hypothetical protein